ncbi:hypothetical protein [Afifella marina]|uniref:Flagellar FliJ protein n=1 Tax=Afifella marina DSM 2698 TaxID=1120955 RepID=A0A1G5MW47_AFIMA|nr:hypothetical protein [Afifella marina]MBK1622015.1 hypothetical protein [Afifella marina DSM 2698]MBK1627808.1 hypothetical protein [Afifella marina]MBK5916775.1 hypothetical protein [Afifella marina]RAI19899.1 hypothetical protein CH311_11355 [Afifella marina DSM 2698]SCZ28789.1 hypothetical protein SAMN03080610_01043 [Afifella marina DSM 2698]
MKDRSKKIERILQVQKKMHEVAEWELADISRQGSALDQERRALIEALNDDDTFHGLFVDAKVKRLSRLSSEADQLARRQAEQTAQVLAQARRLKTTERLSGKLERESRKAEERRSFQLLLEAFARPTDASPA